MQRKSRSKGPVRVIASSADRDLKWACLQGADDNRQGRQGKARFQHQRSSAHLACCVAEASECFACGHDVLCRAKADARPNSNNHDHRNNLPNNTHPMCQSFVSTLVPGIASVFQLDTHQQVTRTRTRTCNSCAYRQEDE